MAFEIDKERFGAFVSGRRKALGLTQKELAARLFVSDKAVSKWERGQSMPDIALLAPLAECLGVSVTELLEGMLALPDGGGLWLLAGGLWLLAGELLEAGWEDGLALSGAVLPG